MAPTLSDVRFPADVAKSIRKAVEALGISVEADDKEGQREVTPTPGAPLVVFINSKSGGRMGPALFDHLTDLVGPVQVYELLKAKPNVVMPAILSSLEESAQQGSATAQHTRDHLRVIVAGGDGTVGWMLSVLEPLPLHPPVAVIPLGTGNDLSRSFGWGPTFGKATREIVTSRLLQGAAASAQHLDSWSLSLIPSPDVDVASIHAPHSLHKASTQGDNARTEFTGNFYNYFSIGMDAEVANAFHHLRQEKPWVARGPRVNKMIYSSYGCTQGWFCAPCSVMPPTRCLHMAANVMIQKEEKGPWVDLPIPHSLRSMVVLNLQSYAGGRDIWGKPSQEAQDKSGWAPATHNDGRLEVVGLKDGWHSLYVLGKLGPAMRLAQAFGVRMELRGEHRRRVYLQLDGEPWEQPLSVDGSDATVVEITRKEKQAVMLLNKE